MMANLSVITISIDMEKSLSMERKKIHLRRFERISLRKNHFNFDELILVNSFAFDDQ